TGLLAPNGTPPPALAVADSTNSTPETKLNNGGEDVLYGAIQYLDILATPPHALKRTHRGCPIVELPGDRPSLHRRYPQRFSGGWPRYRGRFHRDAGSEHQHLDSPIRGRLDWLPRDTWTANLCLCLPHRRQPLDDNRHWCGEWAHE